MCVSLAAIVALPAAARVRHNDAWARAAICEGGADARGAERASGGRADTARVSAGIDAYRRVYFGSPASSKADPSVVATAELMVEMGRRFDDNKILRGAVESIAFCARNIRGASIGSRRCSRSARSIRTI